MYFKILKFIFLRILDPITMFLCYQKYVDEYIYTHLHIYIIETSSKSSDLTNIFSGSKRFLNIHTFFGIK